MKANVKEVGRYTVTVDVGHYVEEEHASAAGHPYPHKWIEKKWVKTGEKNVVVALSMDLEKIARRLTNAAARSKTGKAQFMSGAIVAKRVAV